MAELRMNAYYYSFDGTGEPAIDRILSAVACAGKAEHHTTYWTDEHEPYEGHTGNTCVAWIQSAAVSAASEVKMLRDKLTDCERNLQRAVQDLGALEKLRAAPDMPFVVEVLELYRAKLRRTKQPKLAALVTQVVELLQPGEVSRGE